MFCCPEIMVPYLFRLYGDNTLSSSTAFFLCLLHLITTCWRVMPFIKAISSILMIERNFHKHLKDSNEGNWTSCADALYGLLSLSFMNGSSLSFHHAQLSYSTGPHCLPHHETQSGLGCGNMHWICLCSLFPKKSYKMTEFHLHYCLWHGLLDGLLMF